MNNKIEKYNQAYKKALATIFLKELPGVMPLSVSDVLVDPSLKHGKVYLKTTPEILHEVELKRSAILTSLTKHVNTRYTPSFSFVLDDSYLDNMDNLYEKIDSEEDKN